MNIVIETNRMMLRHLEISDVDDLSRVLSDEESMKYYPHPMTRAKVLHWIEWNIENYRKYGFGLWAVIRKNDMQFLGDCGITMQNIDHHILPEVGYHIIKEYRMNGYATEAAVAAIQYAARQNSIPKIYSYCTVGNIPSISVMKKIGMTEEKTFEKDGIRYVVYSKNLIER